MLGNLINNKVVVSENISIETNGIGESINGRLELALFEAAYLMERGLLEVEGAPLPEFLKCAGAIDPRFYVKYIVYKDLKGRGYKFVKAGLKYGSDFRLYPRECKSMDDEHASYCVFAVTDTDLFPWSTFTSMNRVSHSTRKKLMLAICDTDQSVVYYESNWIRP